MSLYISLCTMFAFNGTSAFAASNTNFIHQLSCHSIHKQQDCCSKTFWYCCISLHVSVHRQSCVHQLSSVCSSSLEQGSMCPCHNWRRLEACGGAKNGTQLARKLMDAFWDRETLARSSLSSKRKYQYQQLDPNVISAIEGVCILFILGLKFAALIFNVFCKYYIYRVSYSTECFFYLLNTDGVGIGTVLQFLSLECDYMYTY